MDPNLERIINYINHYYNGIWDIETLQQNIALYINLFDSIDNRQLYNEMLKLDANIESIRFTISNDDQMEAVRQYMEQFYSHINDLDLPTQR